jgi:predicted transcriptional regulator
MTLQIRTIDTISGISIKRVRGFFRYLVAWHQHSFELPRLQQHLSLDNESALALVAELESQGYIKRPENGVYTFTEKGEELVRASAAGKVSRQTAEHALIGLLARVEQYNADPTKLLTVEAVVVFGSFLGINEKLGDLDIAVKDRRRNLDDPDPSATAHVYAERSGRHFSNIVEFISWPNTELRQILKARKRTIAIQDWHTFLRMAAGPDQFQYKVVFGSPEAVAADIRSRLKNNG